MAVLEQGYHGNSIAGIEVSSYKFDGRGGSGTPPNIIKLPLPKEYMGIFRAEQNMQALQKHNCSGR